MPWGRAIFSFINAQKSWPWHSTSAPDHIVVERVSNFLKKSMGKDKRTPWNKMTVLFFKCSKSAKSRRSSLALSGSLRSDSPPFLWPPSSLRRALESRLLVVFEEPPGRRRFATFLAKASELARNPGLSDLSWADDPEYS